MEEGRKERQLAKAVFIVVVCISLATASSAVAEEQVVHTQTFLSPAFELGFGEVTNKYQIIDWPQQHIAIRSFYAEVVDENGIPVPLYAVYLHHWAVTEQFVKKGAKDIPQSNGELKGAVKNSSFDSRQRYPEDADDEQGKIYTLCENDFRSTEYFGAGSETRRSNLTLPVPYGIISGDPNKVPEGYEEVWVINIHAIRTQGAVDVIGCYECLCKTYGATEDKDGNSLAENYLGGLLCCPDKAHCITKEGLDAAKKKFFLKYTLTWVDWDPGVIPVIRKYMMDVTDPRTSLTEVPDCKDEYTVPPCNEKSSSVCIDQRHSIAALPEGVDLIYAVLHQHAGGLGGVLLDKHGRVLCQAETVYGTGDAAGDEAGYIVGITHCTPEPGTMYIEALQELHFDAYYSNEVGHTGVMSHMFLYVAYPVNYIAEVTHE